MSQKIIVYEYYDSFCKDRSCENLSIVHRGGCESCHCKIQQNTTEHIMSVPVTCPYIHHLMDNSEYDWGHSKL